ncbi:hypothetical protein Hte_000141 [Hypoxylon texense]
MASTDADERFQESDLRKALEAIDCKGDFASLQAIQRCDPEIFVEDVGQIHLPLSEAQARQLIEKSHQAPFGKGSDTIIDTSVRKTWELNPSQFELRGASWQSELDAILSIVRDQLGITAPITAKLYKMLIYEEGAMFKAHTDTEKIPGMFGTLVISLPSPHEGGDVVVKHCGVEKTLQTSKEDMSCLFWYSDVSHEVLPLTAGYRWVLTYNLAIDPAAELPAADSLLENQELRRALQSWSQKVEDGSIAPTPRYWILNHKYTEANISYQGLKTIDRERVRYLQKMCIELGFDLFLATLEKETGGPCENGMYVESGEEGPGGHHPLDYVCNIKYRSKFIFDLSGNTLAADMPLDANSILDGKGVFKGKPDEEDYEGYMGNWGPEATHWYRLSALIIVPCKGTVSSLTLHGGYAFGPHSSSDVHNLCNFFVAKHRNAPESKLPLRQLYELLQKNYTDKSFRFKTEVAGDCLLKVLQVSIHGNEPRLLELMLSRNKQRPPTEFFAWIKKEYDNSAISIDDFEKLYGPIQDIKGLKTDFYRLVYAIDLHSTVYKDLEAISIVTEDAEMTDEIRDIIYCTIDGCMENYRKWDLREEEGPALFDFALDHRDFNYLKEVRRRGEIPGIESELLFKRVARRVLGELKPAYLTTAKGSPPKDATISPYADYITFESMLKFITTLISYGSEEHLELFGERVDSQAERIEAKELNRFWMPLLWELFAFLKKREIPPCAPHWRQIYQSVFTAYLLNYVGDLPPEPSLARRYGYCSCADCASMREFLCDPSEKVGRFAVSDKRRRHLEIRLDMSDVDCKKATERNGIPYTLVVTKTTLHHKAEVEAWRKRRARAGSLFKKFDQDMLRIALEDQFDDIMSMKLIEPEEEPASPNDLVPSASEQHAAVPVGLPAAPVFDRVLPSIETANMPPKRPAPDTWEELPPKRSMLEVSRMISQTAEQLRASRASKPRNAGSSEPLPNVGGVTRLAGFDTVPRPTAAMMGTNPLAGVKREHGELETIDLTSDN